MKRQINTYGVGQWFKKDENLFILVVSDWSRVQLIDITNSRCVYPIITVENVNEVTKEEFPELFNEYNVMNTL